MGRKCPVCASDCVNIRGVTAADSAAHFVSEREDAARNARVEASIIKIWGGAKAEIVRCRTCGLRFSNPTVGGNSEFYSQAFKRSGGYPRAKWDFDRTIQETRQMQLSNVVEVGAGPGAFVEKIASPSVRVTAFEYDVESLEKLRALGAIAVQGDFRDGQPKGDADALFMFQALEHMSDPVLAISTAALYLRSGGSFFLTVPNGEHIRIQEESGSLLDMPPNHVTTWTPNALERAATLGGFNVRTIDIEPFRLIKYIKTDLQFYFLKRAQRKGSFAEAIRASRSRALMALLALIHAPMRLFWWARVVRLAEGPTIWAHFVKA